MTQAAQNMTINELMQYSEEVNRAFIIKKKLEVRGLSANCFILDNTLICQIGERRYEIPDIKELINGEIARDALVENLYIRYRRDNGIVLI